MVGAASPPQPILGFNKFSFLTRQRLELLVHFFCQQQITKSLSANAWDDAMSEINNSNPEKQNLRRQRINQLFTTWSMLDSEDEQKESLEIIESVECISI